MGRRNKTLMYVAIILVALAAIVWGLPKMTERESTTAVPVIDATYIVDSIIRERTRQINEDIEIVSRSIGEMNKRINEQKVVIRLEADGVMRDTFVAHPRDGIYNLVLRLNEK